MAIASHLSRRIVMMKRLAVTLSPSLVRKIEEDRKLRESHGLRAAILFPQKLWESYLGRDDEENLYSGMSEGVERLFSRDATPERRYILEAFEDATRVQAYVERRDWFIVRVTFHKGREQKAVVTAWYSSNGEDVHFTVGI